MPLYKTCRHQKAAWIMTVVNMQCLRLFTAGSVLLQDEASSSHDVTINMDPVDRDRYQQQLQLIDENVSKYWQPVTGPYYL